MNPSRLSLARRKRAYTKKHLAELAGFGIRTITAYENGEIEPSLEAVKRLAEVLQFPVKFFYGNDIPEPQLDSASFRSLSRMTARQRDAALASGSLGFYLGEWIESRFTLPKVDIPELSGMDPDSAPDVVRSEWGLGWQPVSNMVHLLESKGVFVFSLECQREVDAFSTWKDGRPFVFLNTNTTTERSRMDAAHELGHLVLHRHQNKRQRDVEREARVFASSFLMPRPDVLAHARRWPSVHSVVEDKARWKVSAIAYIVRLHRIGLVTDWHYRQLCIQLAKLLSPRKTKELRTVAREGSQLLSQVFSMLRTEGLQRSQIARELNLRSEDFNSLVFGLVISSITGGGEGSPSDTAGVKSKLRLVK